MKLYDNLVNRLILIIVDRVIIMLKLLLEKLEDLINF